LFGAEETTRFQNAWRQVQAGFVDGPREAVDRADALVNDAIERLSAVFARQRSALQREWDKDGNVSTEQLRQTLQLYRSFFNRLLAVSSPMTGAQREAGLTKDQAAALAQEEERANIVDQQTMGSAAQAVDSAANRRDRAKPAD
jgi:hypothetical protein